MRVGNLALTRTRGENIRAGQDVVLEDKYTWRVLRNERGIGGSGAVELHHRDRGRMWRGYEHWDSFNVVRREDI